MANLSKIIKISKSDYDTLAGGGSITKSGQTYTYDADAIYLITPQAVGSASQPIYINSNGDFVAGDEIPDVPTDLSDFNNDVGYTTNVGTVTSVNNTSPDANGNVSLSIPSEVTESTVTNWGFTKNTGTITGVQLNGATIASSGVANVKALPNFNLNISHQTAGNPRQVKFLTVDYNTAATYFKMSATSCHDNGTSYQFLEDIIIGCTTSGTVVCNIYKYCQQSCTLDNDTRYYGDVFYVINTTNKIVDFYILCGQYSSSQFTPATKIGNTTIAYITQYTGTATYYSSGAKNWVNGCGTTYARKDDVPSFSARGSTTTPVYLSATNTFANCSTYAGGTKVTLNGTDKGASTASFYAATSAITTSTSKRYLLGSSSTTSMTTTNTNGSCYMSGNYLYSGGTRVLTILYIHNVTMAATSGNDKFEVNIMYVSTDGNSASGVDSVWTKLTGSIYGYIACSGALRSAYFSSCLPITRGYASGSTFYYYYTLPFSNGGTTGYTTMAKSNFTSANDNVVGSIAY